MSKKKEMKIKEKLIRDFIENTTLDDKWEILVNFIDTSSTKKDIQISDVLILRDTPVIHPRDHKILKFIVDKIMEDYGFRPEGSSSYRYGADSLNIDYLKMEYICVKKVWDKYHTRETFSEPKTAEIVGLEFRLEIANSVMRRKQIYFKKLLQNYQEVRRDFEYYLELCKRRILGRAEWYRNMEERSKQVERMSESSIVSEFKFLLNMFGDSDKIKIEKSSASLDIRFFPKTDEDVKNMLELIERIKETYKRWREKR